ncbi:glycerophosphodiester phosphodiesterase [Phyllobacterium phragmitis]|uniref:Glycerophosphodiester phosphodiesterase n=1 Tax=Phyllobacterium phragmitis TaxID=2670329 RepID=A0A2S9IS78_9HYPH|nr:esterase-like activity of phytase family protein [Phyllobacterium phragmitis]PRD43384.1 glycerophosphodiester phosphodiesterase [Phyllobacterium phragmitis]
MKALLLSTTAAIVVLISTQAFSEETRFPARLEAQAILPANSIIKAPEDAPEHLQTSGKFTAPNRHRTAGIGTVPGMDGNRPTGPALPFDGQPLQGFSGIKSMGDGTFWTLSDNGFGSKLNSPDAALMLHHIKFDWDAGKVEPIETLFLSDPDRKIPFPIVLEGTDKRYLTGSDFDVESIQPVEDGFWIGEEFGPFLVHVDRAGKVTDVVETMVEGEPVRSPDYPSFTLPGNPTMKMPAINLKRSGGFEGMARSKDGGKLYALLEGPRYLADGSVEKSGDNPALRIVEFDIAGKKWTGRSWLYPLSEGGRAIGDFNMIDATTGLVIERDNGEGVAAKACADPKNPQPDCFSTPAKFKRIYKIEMNDANVGGPVRKIGYIDLLAVEDPGKKARQGGEEGIYDMPFVTIENVDVVDENHIVVGNDNNLPFSAGRALDKADDNEFVLLEVGEFLKAK